MILYKTNIIECLNSPDRKIEIESTDPLYPFNLNQQISDVSIDLRLGYKGYILSEELTELNTLLENVPFQQYFIEKTIDSNGYVLNPHQIIFCPTLEMVGINDRNLMGYVCGRITFARMGIGVVCDQVKVPYGYKSVIGLQIKNNTEVPVRIFGRQKIAQILFYQVTQATGPYNGEYGRDREYTFPIVKESEFFSYSDSERHNIQMNKPKKKYLIPKQIMKRYEMMKRYHVIKHSTWMGYITALISACILPYATNPDAYNRELFYGRMTIFGIIMIALVLADIIFGFVIFNMKKIKGEEEEHG